MAFDEALAERVRYLLASESDIEEKKMFGGIAFMASGNMSVGVNGNSLIVRVGKDAHEEAMAEPGVDEFAMTGRPMSGWVLVDREVIRGESDLRRWVDRGVDFARSLES